MLLQRAHRTANLRIISRVILAVPGQSCARADPANQQVLEDKWRAHQRYNVSPFGTRTHPRDCEAPSIRHIALATCPSSQARHPVHAASTSLTLRAQNQTFQFKTAQARPALWGEKSPGNRPGVQVRALRQRPFWPPGPGPRTICTPRLSTAARSRITPCASEPLLARASLHAPLRTPGPPTTLALQALHATFPLLEGLASSQLRPLGAKRNNFPPRLATNKTSVPHYQACLAQPGISRPIWCPCIAHFRVQNPAAESSLLLRRSGFNPRC